MDFGYSIDGNRICQNCRAEIPFVSRICGKCSSIPDVPNPSKSGMKGGTLAGYTFRLSSLILTTTLIAVCLGVGTWSPGLAVVLALLSVPAYVRTVFVGLRLRREGRHLSIEHKILTYLASLSIAAGTVVAPMLAFCTICGMAFIAAMIVGGVFGWHELDLLGPALLFGLYLGAIAAVAAFLASIRWLWPYRKAW